jgi:hypothetical protein
MSSRLSVADPTLPQALSIASELFKTYANDNGLTSKRAVAQLLSDADMARSPEAALRMIDARLPPCEHLEEYQFLRLFAKQLFRESVVKLVQQLPASELSVLTKLSGHARSLNISGIESYFKVKN